MIKDQSEISHRNQSEQCLSSLIIKNTEIPEIPIQNKKNETIIFQYSIYKGRPATIFFEYPSVCNQKRDKARTFEIKEKQIIQKYDLKYSTGSVLKPFYCVTQCFENAGFRKCQQELNDWNGHWAGKMRNTKKMNKFQKTNHFPGCWNLGRKDLLWMRQSKMKRQFPKEYNFLPTTYLLKCEWEAFVNKINKKKNKQIWIWKPVASACGRGIQRNIDVNKIFSQIHDIIIKTCIAVEPFMLNSINKQPEHRNNCFELYGFDVLVDKNLKVWLLEVNVCPSLSSTSPLDKIIKTSLICDILHIVGFQGYYKKQYKKQQQQYSKINQNINVVEENKILFSRDIKCISELNYDNCFDLLSDQDWEVMFQTDEEFYRKGQNFKRIFPPENTKKIRYYSQFFQFKRYYNEIIWNMYNSEQNYLEKIYKKND
ncbi:tubulin-tyrosine ligase family protein, putative [Ichthyophthirius multifiliis]|uniref:Tubulin--tyrosine ligase-like protein 5 n=1 Tax=Ichthyophthirius multifiliis TaxID=5932 RepID=G0QXI7_ICHMU|nr:tubulin-tyrosine ligase family protein, putative [Ichthyophthirius multifiliis]EGR30069.1 tubulin-tyrosine ligase family protein, putative [Ichthyophthirius multifiliis]|eukprot:XP_004031305.1 tubulin-tyrosine ligase family protein, putative [Ichthyophthirius multifiliis]